LAHCNDSRFRDIDYSRVCSMTLAPPNYRAGLDAGRELCYMSGVVGPARVSAGRSATHVMRFALSIIVLALFAGCARDDVRLHGTWRSNRDATVGAAFRRDPRWTNAPPEKVERFREMFGHMTITYSNRVGVAHSGDEAYSFRYHVVSRGPDYIVMRDDAPMDMGRDIRVRFVDGGTGHWIDTGPLGFGLEERFDRVQSR
jgi:hypothetical protein